MFKKIIAFILIFMFALAQFTGCKFTIISPDDTKTTNNSVDNTNSNNNNNSNENELWNSKADLELYPAYAAIPQGYALYLDWNVSGGQELDWKSSDTSVLSVDSDGLLTAVSTGEAVVTASLKNKPNITSACGIHVSEFKDGENAQNDILQR